MVTYSVFVFILICRTTYGRKEMINSCRFEEEGGVHHSLTSITA
jgi:hypothetical protein